MQETEKKIIVLEDEELEEVAAGVVASGGLHIWFN